MNEFATIPLDVPYFARISDWFGLWAMESAAFAGHLAMMRSVDIAAHMRNSKPLELVSALEKIPARNGQSIGVIKIAGTMMKSQSSMGGGASTVQLRRDIRQAAADPEVSGILLAIDSPGGTVAGTDDLAVDVRAARDKKPVYAHIDDLGASAAYWVASQADKIYANSSTAMVGSIGTMTTIYDASEAAAKEGVKAILIKTGPLKGAGTPGTVITEEQRAYFQDLINQSQKSFDSAVKNGRKLSVKELADVRSGAVFGAETAQTRKLIDGIQPMGKTMAELTRAASRSVSATAEYSASEGGSLPMSRKVLPTLEIKQGEGFTLPTDYVVKQM